MLFRHRSYKKEFLDQDNIPVVDLYRNLDELHVINRLLGGYRASVSGLADILKNKPGYRTILDIGSGGGNTIKYLSDYCLNNNFQFFFYGVDLKQECLLYAEAYLAGMKNKKLLCDDYRELSEDLLAQIDIIHCSLFLHHLTDDEIINLFKFARKNGCIMLVNDLQRNRIAYYSIKILTFLFSRSWLVKNDAPLSVLRGFNRRELVSFLKKSGFTEYTVKWEWAFRYVIIAKA